MLETTPGVSAVASIDIHIANQKFIVKGDDGDAHLAEVATQVQNKIDSLIVEHPTMTAAKVALLAAVEFASQAIKGRNQVDDYRGSILLKAGDILDRIERELAPPTN
jgi:cell division protein ZapA (FtsZ GTPase activity inhibitor)